MDVKIKIGISNADSEAKYLNYARWLKGDDENIEIIKLNAIDDNIDRVSEIDALVLTGGIDTHPKFYGSNTLNYDHAPKIFNEPRDVFEIKLFEEAQQKKIAILGICRGMQLVNCILGGDLVQDNGIDSNNLHKNDGKDKLHSVQIFSGTLLNEITKVEFSTANSAHHQSIHKLGNGLKVNAKSADGIIEGLEWEDKTGKPFFLAVQWHPERMDQSALGESPLSKNIREYLLSDIKRNKK
ncbi:MAG: gamma-glutamyl-gamma-aminobutyrate hydrolase family protein [Bacteroidetes bacterium]|nr:gamma-glutamyl-gamma-aminobutyrate hydrolase family protein [Bacteroidota bacterium]